MKVFVLICCLGAGLFLAGCCTPEQIATKTVTLRPQETGMWCWAASGEMTMESLGTSIDQCDEANKRFGRSDCCNNPVPDDCVNGGWPEYDKYGFTASHTSDAPLSWDQVKDQIYCKQKPFAFSWHWSGGGGHMMVIAGYVTLNGTNYVYKDNPWPPPDPAHGIPGGEAAIVPYSEYVSGPGYTHWDDYYDITKQ